MWRERLWASASKRRFEYSKHVRQQFIETSDVEISSMRAIASPGVSVVVPLCRELWENDGERTRTTTKHKARCVSVHSWVKAPPEC